MSRGCLWVLGLSLLLLSACSSPEDVPSTDKRDACETFKEVDEQAYLQCKEQLGVD